MNESLIFAKLHRRLFHPSAVKIEVARYNGYTRFVEILTAWRARRIRSRVRQDSGLQETRGIRMDTEPATRREISSKDNANMVTNPESSYPGLPIVFIHYSNSDYLKYILPQARLYNPTSPIYLIGDESNRGYETIEHHMASDYFETAHDFSKIYRHFHTSNYQFELFNFQRWLILNEFVQARGLTQCLYLDTDTLLYTNVSERQKRFAEFDFTLSFMDCGSTFFLNRVEALSDFAQFLMEIYNGKEKYLYNKMLAHYATFQKSGTRGGVCDNCAFDCYRYEHFGEIGETALIIDGSFFDPIFDYPHPGLVMENGVKKVVWKDGEPFGIHARTGKEIKFDSIQFHGRTKSILSL
jgi:hypothetical protein